MLDLERELIGHTVVKIAFEVDTAIAGPIRDAIERDNLADAQTAVWSDNKIKNKREYLGHIANLSAYYRFHAVRDETYNPDEWASSSEIPGPEDPDYLTNLLCISHLNIPISGELMFGVPARWAKLFGMNKLMDEVEVVGNQVAIGTVYADTSPKQVEKREFYLPGDPRFEIAFAVASGLLVASAFQLRDYRIPGVQPPAQTIESLGLPPRKIAKPQLIVPRQIRDLVPPALRAA